MVEKIIAEIKEATKEWIAKQKEKQYKKELLNRKEICLANLLSDIETEDAIKIYNDVSESFLAAMGKRLDRITKEKKAIQLFKESL